MNKKTKIIIALITLGILFLATWIYNQVTSEDETLEPVVIEKKETKQTGFTHIEKEFEYYKVMTRYGRSVEEIEYIKDECKRYKETEEWSYHQCLAITTSIAWIEWNNWQNQNWVGYSRNNLFSFKTRWYDWSVKKSWFKYYETRLDSIKDFFRLYHKHWYKNSCQEMVTRSKYTHEEEWIDNCYKMVRKFTYIK